MTVVSLSEVVSSLESGSRPKGGIVDGVGDIPSLGAEHLDGQGGFKFLKLKLIPRSFFSSMKNGIIQKGDILIVKDGATTGKVSFVGDDFPYKKASINEHVFCLRLDEKKAHPKYVFWHLQSPKGQQQILKDFRGATVGGISRGFMDEIEFPLPLIGEQQRIATILDKADAIRRKRQESIRLTEEFFRSVFLDMFGDPVTNPKGVKVVQLSDITTIITDGVHQKPTYTETGVPFISVKDITTGVLKFDNCKFVSLEDHRKFTKRCKAERFDILYTKVGATYGRPALVDTDREFSIYVSVCLIKSQKKLVDPLYLKAVLGTSAIKNQADKRIKGIGVPDLHLDQIQQFLIPLPTREHQREFALRVAAIENLKSSHLASLAELNMLSNSLTQRAFRGEL